MSRKKLALFIGLVTALAAIAGGIVYAQESGPIALIDDQDPGSTARTLSFFVGDGAFLGVGTEDISKENMARYGMREVRGVGVTEVLKDSPAEKAGLRKDDVIFRFDGESVKAKDHIVFAQAGFFGRTVFQDFGDADAAHFAHPVTRHIFFADVFSADAEKR